MVSPRRAHQSGLQTGQCETHAPAVRAGGCGRFDVSSGQSGITCATTYKWESEVTSLKMPSGSSEISLPCRDLREEGGGGNEQFLVFG